MRSFRVLRDAYPLCTVTVSADTAASTAASKVSE